MMMANYLFGVNIIINIHQPQMGVEKTNATLMLEKFSKTPMVGKKGKELSSIKPLFHDYTL